MFSIIVKHNLIFVQTGPSQNRGELRSPQKISRKIQFSRSKRVILKKRFDNEIGQELRSPWVSVHIGHDLYAMYVSGVVITWANICIYKDDIYVTSLTTIVHMFLIMSHTNRDNRKIKERLVQPRLTTFNRDKRFNPISSIKTLSLIKKFIRNYSYFSTYSLT